MDITDKIERLEAMEERCDISLEALYASIKERYYSDGEHQVMLNGEVHARNGTTIHKNVILVLTLHDVAGRVLEMSTIIICEDDFFGIEAFSFSVSIHEAPCKVRIYPTFY